jgi:5-oxopent-3-ene-1,2,5-tricarboxylate decarboxylase/2-hydroxyhepta-2,4-diene-1,7-dioate isomerase
MIAGTAYGVILNDSAEREALASAFSAPPYNAPPIAPILYIKPRNTFASSGATICLDEDVDELEASATLALEFGRDAFAVEPSVALDYVCAARLALDLCEPLSNHYRPSVRQRCRDGFLPLGQCVSFSVQQLGVEISTSVDGKEVSRWPLTRLHRQAATLIADVSAFMTLAAGDILLLMLLESVRVTMLR